MPASRTISTISSGVASGSGFAMGFMLSSMVRRPSFSMTTFVTGVPIALRRVTMARTVPETLAWTGHPSPPATSPSFCPIFTLSPTLTTGVAGAPICWESGMETLAGSGRRSVESAAVSLCSSRCVPPRKVNRFIPLFLLPFFRSSRNGVFVYYTMKKSFCQFPIDRIFAVFTRDLTFRQKSAILSAEKRGCSL